MTTLDELEAIRARHWVAGQYVTLALDAGQQAHTDRATLLRLLDAAREELREVREAALSALGLLDDPCCPVTGRDETRRARAILATALTKDATPSPGAITGIRKAADPCSDCIDGWCQMNCGPRVG